MFTHLIALLSQKRTVIVIRLPFFSVIFGLRQVILPCGQFLRRLKAFTGMTPTDYVTSLRLQQAKELLTGSPLPVKKIANVCGFENEYDFSNFFEKHTGRSPKAFRTESFWRFDRATPWIAEHPSTQQKLLSQRSVCRNFCSCGNFSFMVY